MGVFATRSPYRPNGLGLSSVRLLSVNHQAKDGPLLVVGGADLMDGTPIYDIKPYLPYADAHPDACGGLSDATEWTRLTVKGVENIAHLFTPADIDTITTLLANDPRPQYHTDPNRIYAMTFKGRDVRFRVEDGVVYVCEEEILK